MESNTSRQSSAAEQTSVRLSRRDYSRATAAVRQAAGVLGSDPEKADIARSYEDLFSHLVEVREYRGEYLYKQGYLDVDLSDRDLGRLVRATRVACGHAADDAVAAGFEDLFGRLSAARSA